jgi:pimeloyl-ACP methyl ester carboxylesterase
MQIEAEPKQSLMDETVTILVGGLKTGDKFTIVATCSLNLAQGEALFYSFATFTQSESDKCEIENDLGTKNKSGCKLTETSRLPSLSGTYVGVEPMGLFWSMVAAPGQKQGLRFLISDVTKPAKVKLTLLRNHHSCDVISSRVHDIHKGSVGSDNDIVTQSCCWVERWYLKWDGSVKRIPVKAGRVRGMVFVPQNSNNNSYNENKPCQYPGVIDMFGTAGGLIEMRAALLASHGFAALALAYFDFDDLPKGINLDLEYFSEAADWLESQPFVKKGSIGAVGVSYGACMALTLALMNHKVRAVVSINPTHYYSASILHYKGVEVPTYFDTENMLTEHPAGFVLSGMYPVSGRAEISRATIPIHLAPRTTSFLLLHSSDDQCILAEHSVQLIRRLQLNPDTNSDTWSWICSTPNKVRKTVQTSAENDHNSVQNTHKHENRERITETVQSSSSRLVLYPGAGHLIEPPYAPVKLAVFAKIIDAVTFYGGDTPLHARAQELAWKELLTFLHSRLAGGFSQL